MRLSMRSYMPPWPGRIAPESFTEAPRLKADSIKSPICPAMLPSAGDDHHVDDVDLHPAGKQHGYEKRGEQIAERAFPGLLGAERRGHGHAAERAPHEIGEHVAGPDQAKSKEHQAAAHHGDFVEPHEIAERQGDEQQPGGADGNRRKHFLQRSAGGEADRDATKEKDQKHRFDLEQAARGIADEQRRRRQRNGSRRGQANTARRTELVEQAIVHLRKGLAPRRSPRSKNSNRAIPPTSRRNGRKNQRRRKPDESHHQRNQNSSRKYAQEHPASLSLSRRGASARGAEAAVTALALLVIDAALRAGGRAKNPATAPA